MSKEYVLRNSNTVLTPNNIKPVFDAYYSALEFLEDDKQHLTKQIEKRVRILERESGIQSGIAFNTGSKEIPSILKQLLQMDEPIEDINENK